MAHTDGAAHSVSEGDVMKKKAFCRLKMTEIRPEGWLLDQLKTQMGGLSGILYDMWDSVGSYSGWLGGTGDAWERAPYYLDGLLPLSYYLQDSRHMEICSRFIAWTLSSQDDEGNFGPVNTRADYWSRFVMLKVLIQYYEITGDKSILSFEEKYFEYAAKAFRKRPPVNWSAARIPELLFCMKYIYEQTGNERVAELAREVERYSMDWTAFMDVFPFPRPTDFYVKWDPVKDYNHSRLDEIIPFHLTHIVNIAMGVKQPSLHAFFFGGDSRDINRRGFDQLDRFHGTPSGCINGDEHLSGTDPRQGAELCSVVEFMFSLQVMLEITGDPYLADRLERLAYNALPATITEDYMAHQYLQQANQVCVDIRRRSWYNNRDDATIFGLEPNFGCCTANMHQGWPKFVNALWYKGNNELISAVFAPSSVCTELDGEQIRVELSTQYPFEKTLNYQIKNSCQKEHTIKIRVPSWCPDPELVFNGERLRVSVSDGYLYLSRVFQKGDTVTVTLPMPARFTFWHRGSRVLERGPLVYALNIKERFETIKELCGVRDYCVYPESPWNFAIYADEALFEEKPVAATPFSKKAPPVTAYLRARSVPGWTMENGNTGELPVISENGELGEEQTIELIPYGCTNLRVTEFPEIKTII